MLEEPQRSAGRGRVATIALRDELTTRTARAFCEAVDAALDSAPQVVVLDVGAAKIVDVVGLAALLQSVSRVEGRRIACEVVPGVAVHAAALRGRVVEALPLALERESANVTFVGAEMHEPPPVFARTPRIVLRQPTWDELGLFERWAHDPLLDQMVGSDLLYQCRHLGAYHPDFVAAIFGDATALTAVVQPHGAESPVGFVRLHGISLVQQFGFLETAMATGVPVRRACGIDASRLLLAYAVDTLRLERVEAKVYAYNTLSANSLRRNGFEEEGVLRGARTYDGRRWDIRVFSILAAEMRAERTCERFPYMGLWNGGR